MKKHEDHICRFNDGEQSCDCYSDGFRQGALAHAAAIRLEKEEVNEYRADSLGASLESIEEEKYVQWKRGINRAIAEQEALSDAFLKGLGEEK